MAARKPSERRHGAGDAEIPDLNLVPIMAIMVILIPMLIYMFTFHQIKVQRVMAPRRGTAAKKPQDEQKQKELNLTIMIKGGRDASTWRGFQLTWEEQLMQGENQSPLIPLVAVDAENCGDQDDPEGDAAAQGCGWQPGGCMCFDFRALYNALVEKKDRFSTAEKPEKRVNITADLDIPWGVVSRAIDAATCRLEQPAYATFSDYATAKPKAGELVEVPGVDDPLQMCEELFPNVVFAMAD
jgi:biopolymer transport protein ExbD